MFRDLILQFLKLFLWLIDKIFFSRKQDILFHGYMGIPSGNTLALYKYIKSNNLLNCSLYWITKDQNSEVIDRSFQKKIPSRNASLISHFRFFIFVMRFKVIIVESAGDLSLYLDLLPNNNRLKILLIHGFSLKLGGIQSPHFSNKEKDIWLKVGKKFNIFSVSSKLEKEIVSSSLKINPDKCLIIGPQRSLGVKNCSIKMKSKARSIIEKSYSISLSGFKQIIFYAPTHRDHIKELARPVLFGFDSVDELNDLLKNKNILLFVREHGITDNNQLDLNSNIIYTNNFPSVDFDLLYAAVDGLITDYSGIFLEYLNTNIKFGFWHYDFLEYKQKRGIALSDKIFETGEKIKDKNTFNQFIQSETLSDEINSLRTYWYNLLYENTTDEALKLTVEEINKRVNFIDL